MQYTISNHKKRAAAFCVSYKCGSFFIHRAESHLIRSSSDSSIALIWIICSDIGLVPDVFR